MRLALYEFGAGVAGYVSYVFAIYFVLGMAQAAQQRGDHSSTGLSQPMADMGLSRPGAGMAVDSGEGLPLRLSLPHRGLPLHRHSPRQDRL